MERANCRESEDNDGENDEDGGAGGERGRAWHSTPFQLFCHLCCP
jgi:hypothetical protein